MCKIDRSVRPSVFWKLDSSWLETLLQAFCLYLPLLGVGSLLAHPPGDMKAATKKGRKRGDRRLIYLYRVTKSRSHLTEIFSHTPTRARPHAQRLEPPILLHDFFQLLHSPSRGVSRPQLCSLLERSTLYGMQTAILGWIQRWRVEVPTPSLAKSLRRCSSVDLSNNRYF